MLCCPMLRLFFNSRLQRHAHEVSVEFFLYHSGVVGIVHYASLSIRT